MNKFHMRDLLHIICAVVTLLSAFVGSTLIAAASTDTGTAGSTFVIASVVGIFFFLLSLVEFGVWPMIVNVAIYLKREEEE